MDRTLALLMARVRGRMYECKIRNTGYWLELYVHVAQGMLNIKGAEHVLQASMRMSNC